MPWIDQRFDLGQISLHLVVVFAPTEYTLFIIVDSNDQSEAICMSSKKRKVPRLEKFFQRYLRDEDSAGFIRSVSETYSEPTLQHLAVHGRRTTRRAAIMAIGYFGSYRSNVILGRALRDRDRAVRLLAENGIRTLWTNAEGENAACRVQAIAWLNFSCIFEQAHQQACELIEIAPSFAEAWNQRAIANYGMEEFSLSIYDCEETLEINPYHFLAASGMGNCYLHLQDTASALECFRQALDLNPGLEGVRSQIERVQGAQG